MEVVRALLACIFGRQARREGYTELIYDDDKMALYSDDEPYAQQDAMAYYGAMAPKQAAGDRRTVEDVAKEVAWLLWRAEWNDNALQARVSDAVGDRRWNHKMVEECLDNVIEYVEQGRAPMGKAMCAALDGVTDAADDEFAFPRGHPPSLDGFIAIVSVGVLAEMQGAWVLELLGFGEVRGKEAALDGTGEIAMLTSDKITVSAKPRPGSVADWWARVYDAYIPVGSVYSYLRKLDMVELSE